MRVAVLDGPGVGARLLVGQQRFGLREVAVHHPVPDDPELVVEVGDELVDAPQVPDGGAVAGDQTNGGILRVGHRRPELVVGQEAVELVEVGGPGEVVPEQALAQDGRGSGRRPAPARRARCSAWTASGRTMVRLQSSMAGR